MVNREKKLRNCGSEDRISRLPYDLIHLILSNMDAIDVIQTCLVSTRWRHVWRSVTQLNFHYCRFYTFSKFTKFVSRFLSNRCQESHISVFNLNTAYIRQSEYHISVSGFSCGRTIQHPLIKKIARHARYAQKLNLASKFSFRRTDGVPLSLFNSSSMKELHLISSNLIATNLHGSSWNLQALTTLVCVGVTFTDIPDKSNDYFSNLLNLRHLTLDRCQTLNSDRLHIISTPLETLTISRLWGKAMTMYVVSAPNLSSLKYSGSSAQDSNCISSSDGFPCLERVNINVFSATNNMEKVKGIIFGLFDKLSNAMSLTLSMNTVHLLSTFPELLQNQISPFCNLRFLNIVKDRHWSSPIPRHVITYLCNSSPSPPIIKICENYIRDH